jgi:ADP-ribose pyrophosphatase YjhB (NUDIX family)
VNTVPAVNVAVRDGDRVLLIEQPSGDAWELPGGHPEAEEEPAYAAARELQEEAGVRAESSDLELLSAIHSTHRGMHYNVISYAVQYSETDGTPAPGEEAADVEFWPLDRIFTTPEQTREVDRRVLRAQFDA